MKIRKMTAEDLGPLRRLLSDRRVMEHIEPVFDAEKASAFLESAGLCESPLVWAAEDEGNFIGYVIYHDYDETSRELGWVLFPEYWGKGYALRLTEALIKRAFSENLDAVIECSPGQEVSKHIAARFGFEYEGMREGCEVYRLKRSVPQNGSA